MEIIKTLITKPFEAVWNNITSETRQIVYNRLLEYQIEEYERNYYTKTLLHRSEPVKLHDFYLPLHITKFGKIHRTQKIATENAKELFSAHQFITIIGTAGSGKSTIVKALLVNSIESSYRVPIKIELRYLNSYQGGLFKYVEDEIFKINQLAFDYDIIVRLLNSGNFLIFFDGYDELSSVVKENITRDINNFTKIYNKNAYLLTSRPYTNIELLAKFKNFEVCELSVPEIEVFVRKQILSAEKEIANKIIEAINTDHNNSYKSFLSNPLLLTMFILTFQTYSNVPPKRNIFYKQVFDSLFYLHDSVSKLSYARERKSGLSKEGFEYILRIFCFMSYFKEIFVFEESYLQETLDVIKSKKKSLIFENHKLIEDLQIAICILNKEGMDYVFPHRSLQEYFASLYIINLEAKNKSEAYKKILDQVTQTKRWMFMFSRDNFYTLLTEQDYLGVIKNLSIPFYERMVEQTKTYEPSQIVNIYRTLQYFTASFHPNFKETEEISGATKQYISERNAILKPAYDRSKTPDIELTNDEQLQLDVITKAYFKQLGSILPKTIKNLKDFVKAETESDYSIIELI